jgi:Ca2+-binding RTX toxin-like protein
MVRKSLVMVVVCLMMVLCAATWSAAQEGKNCAREGESTPMEFGDYFNGERCQINRVGDRDGFQFAGNRGDLITINAYRSSNLVTQCVALFDPDGASIGTEICATAFLGTARLTASLGRGGPHRVRVRDAGNNTGSYTLAFDRIVPASPAAQELTFGQGVATALDGIGDVDLYVFAGTRREAVLIEVINDTDSNALDLCVIVFNPSGDSIQLESCADTVVSIGAALTQSGTWSILVRERDNNSGAYTIRVTGPLTCDERNVTIVGTNDDDILEGTEENDVIHGLAGHDIIHGLAGDDIICGGPGHDVLLGGNGNDPLLGGVGNDSLNGNGGDDMLVGGRDTDVCDGGGQTAEGTDTADPSCEAEARVP